MPVAIGLAFFGRLLLTFCLRPCPCLMLLALCFAVPLELLPALDFFFGLRIAIVVCLNSALWTGSCPVSVLLLCDFICTIEAIVWWTEGGCFQGSMGVEPYQSLEGHWRNIY